MPPPGPPPAGSANRLHEHMPRPGPKHAPRPAGSGMGAGESQESKPRRGPKHAPRPAGSGMGHTHDEELNVPTELIDAILAEVGDDAGDIDVVHWNHGRRRLQDDELTPSFMTSELDVLSELGEDDAGDIDLFGGFSVSGNTDDGVEVDGDFDVTGEIDTHIGRRLGHEHYHNDEELNVLSELGEDDAGDIDIFGGFSVSGSTDDGVDVDGDFDVAGEINTHIGRRLGHEHYDNDLSSHGNGRRRAPNYNGRVGMAGRRRAPNYNGRVGMAGRRRKSAQCLCPDRTTVVPAISASGGCHFEQCPSFGRRRIANYKGRVGMAGRRRTSMQCLCPDRKTKVTMSASGVCQLEQCPGAGSRRIPKSVEGVPVSNVGSGDERRRARGDRPGRRGPPRSEDGERRGPPRSEDGEGRRPRGPPRADDEETETTEERRRYRSVVNTNGEERRRARGEGRRGPPRSTHEDGEGRRGLPRSGDNGEGRRPRPDDDETTEERRRYRSLVNKDGDERRRDGLSAAGHSLSGKLPGRRRIRSGY